MFVLLGYNLLINFYNGMCFILITRVEAFAKEYNMFKKNDKILIALSGGPDSICLMHMLVKLREKYNFKLYAAHVNHMLRGEEADKDEEYVEKMCDKYDIKLFIKRVDINKIVKEEGLSSELAGRRERYSFFDEIYEKENIDKIAIAHNANDQTETILMRLIRGSGTHGISGIRPVRDNKFIRPILCLNRADIEQYCEDNELNPRIDKTNLETIYNRNKIRLKLLPYIKENFNEDIVNTINRFGMISAIDNEYMEDQAKKILEDNFVSKDNEGVLKKEIFAEHEAVLSRSIKMALEIVAKVNRNFEMKHIYAVVDLQKGETGKSIQLPNNITVSNVYGDIKITKNVKNYTEDNKSEEVEIKNILETAGNDGINIDFYKYSISMSVIKDKNVNFKANHLIKYFDCDKINNVKIRFRKNGDRIVPMGMRSPKKLKDIFIDKKVPKDQRDLIPIFEFNDNIAWVMGIRTSDIFKVTGDTKNILQVRVQERI